MATLALTYSPATRAIVATFGNVTEVNDRVARIEVRPGMREGETHGLMVRRWGAGHWCSANGNASYFTHRTAAEAYATRWIETGRDQ